MDTPIFDKQPVRFLLVGALNSLFGFLVFSAVVWSNLGPMMGLVAGNLAGLMFNFFTTGGLVFRSLALHRLPRFAACYAATLLTNYALLTLLKPLVNNTFVAQAILTLPMAAMAYVIMTVWVYPNSKKADCPNPD